MNRVQRGTLVATGLGLFMIFLDALIVNVALPDIQSAFDVGESGIQWVVAGYAIGMAVLMMSAATIADLWGRRRLYHASVAVFIAASAACGLAPTILLLSVSRGVQGLAAAGVNVASLALVSAAFDDPDRKAKAIGIWTSIAACGLALGPTIGGILTEFVGWRSVFFVNVPVGLIAMAATVRYVGESRDPGRHDLDVVGQVLFIFAIGSFAWGVIQGPQIGWLSAQLLVCMVTFVVTLTAFIAWELRVESPMMDVRLFTNRTYTLAIVTVFVTLFSAYGMLLMLTQFWQNVRGFSVLATGLLLIPFAVAQILLAPRVGGWVARTGSRPLILSGLTFLVAGIGIEIIGVDVSDVVVFIGSGVVGLGLAFAMTPTTATAMSSVSEDRAGMASGIMSSQRAIGSTAGYAVLGTVLAAWLGASLNDSLATVIPDDQERQQATEQIIDSANPRAYSAEITPQQPFPDASTASSTEIAAAAENDFVGGIQLALAVAAALVALVLALCWRYLPTRAELAAEEVAGTSATRAPPDG